MRYTGGELNIVKKNLSEVSLHGVLCFPEVYEIGMSHHGSQILYHLVNGCRRWAMSRSYTPWLDAEDILRDKSLPLYDLEYFRPLSEADWLGFSVQYELQFTNILTMLDLSGIPLRGIARNESHPVVITGGPSITNPEPIAEFIDAAAIGDGEETIVRICETLERARALSVERGRVREMLSKIPGVYVPSLYETTREKGRVVANFTEPVHAAKIQETASENYPTRPIVPLINVIHQRLSVEVMRGCTRGCRFCAAGMQYRPIRERAVGDILDQIAESVRTTGWRDVGLLSLSTADYSRLDDLLTEISSMRKDAGIGVSLPSTRIDAMDEAQLDRLREVSSMSSFTIAPEAGSQRLRDMINKDFTQESILKTVRTLLARNVQTLKLYFMIGLPGETREDIEAIVGLVRDIAREVRSKGKRRSVNVAISPFSPKPHTPFQWDAMNSPDLLLEKSRFIKTELRTLRNVRVSYRDPLITRLETVMARGDREVADVVEAAWRAGARFDGWDECFSAERWEDAARSLGVSLDRYLGEFNEIETLPWDVVSIGVTKKFLKEERERSVQGIPSPDCRKDVCTTCGVCGPVTNHFAAPRQSSAVLPRSIQYGRATSRRLFFRWIYRKGREVRFLSHLDMVAIVLRAVSASRIPVVFSEGYNPHPKVAFGPPLGMGIMGEREAFDMICEAPVDRPVDTLAPWLPEGLEIVEIHRLSEKPISLSASIAAAEYTFIPLTGTSHAELHDAVATVMGQTELIRVKERKGKTIEKDMRPLIHELELTGNTAQPILRALLWAAPGKTCRPDDLLSFFPTPRPTTDFLITRVRCFTAESEGLSAI